MTVLSSKNKPGHSVELMMVSPDQARLWLNSRPYKGQRPLRPNHVEFLAEEMRRGRFRPQAAVVFSVEDGSRYSLINGNHTLNAIVQCGKPQQVTVFHYQSQDEYDTAETYGAIDINLQRNVSDLFSAMYLKEELGFTATQLNHVGASVRVIYGKFRWFDSRSRRLHMDDFVRAIRDYSAAAHEYIEITSGCNQEIFHPATRGVTMGVALVTLKFAGETIGKDRIRDFWYGAIFDDGIKSDDPRKAANRHLLTTALAGNSRAGATKRVTPQYSARYIANCFNAFVEGRNITRTQVTDTLSPIKILGTPFTGNE